MRNSCYSGWRKLELSSTFCNRWSNLFCKRFVLYALCYTARCNLSRRFREDFGTSCVTDYTVYQDLVLDTSVYLVSYDGLLVKTTTQKTVSLSLYLRFYCIKKIIKKNQADLVPACRVVFTLLWVEVFLLFLINIPTLKSWFVHLLRHSRCWHLTTPMIRPPALKWRWHNEGGESPLSMPPRLHSTTS